MGTLTLAAPLVLFEKSRLWAGTGFHLLPSFHHHPTQHKQLHFQSPQPQLSPGHLTDTHPSRNVVCPSGAWFGNRQHLTLSIHHAWNSKHVSAMGWHWNTHNCLSKVELIHLLLFVRVRMSLLRIIFLTFPFCLGANDRHSWHAPKLILYINSHPLTYYDLMSLINS